MPLTKVKVNNLHTEVSTMIQNIAVDNSVDSAAVTSIVNTNIAAKSTSDVSEGSNLYYTDARVDARAQLKIDALVGSAPGTLDTLQELGDALGDDPNFATTVTNSIATKLPLAGGTLTGNLSFGNNDKAIFGTDGNLEIYHDGTNNYIADTTTGNLIIQGSNLILKNQGGTENLADFVTNGAVTLYFDNASKLATTSTGIDVTGTVTSDGLTVDGTINAYRAGFTQGVQLLGDSGGNQIIGTATNDKKLIIKNQAATQGIELIVANKAIDIAKNGDISFYEDTGTTAKFFWDASAERLGIGTASPASMLDIKGLTGNSTITLNSASAIDAYPSIGKLRFYSNDNSTNSSGEVGSIETIGIGTWNGAINNAAMTFNLIQGLAGTTSPVEAMRIDSSGNVGIGTSSPSGTLDVGGQNILNDNYDNIGAIFRRNGSHGAVISLGRQGVSDGVTLDYPSDNIFAVSTAGTERMRIDSSGHLLVGKTSFSTSTRGLTLSSNGRLFATSENDVAVGLNRTQTDGEILRLQKDGSTVGSIGSISGNSIYVGSGNVGVRFSTVNDAIYPSTTSGVNRDAATDLGLSSVRFKDLHLSGAVKVGSGDNVEWSSYSAGTSGVLWTGNGTNNTLDAYTTGSLAMRIDSSGNLLVGTTDTNPASSNVAGGIALRESGQVNVSRDDNPPLQLNRKTADGDIAVFQKDGSTVGSIQSRAGAVSTIILDPSATGGGISGGGAALYPTDHSGTLSNGALTLGDASYRFKDLHLSGTANSSSLNVNGGTIKLDGNYPVGSENVALGDFAFGNLTTGASNTAVGRGTLYSNTTGGSNSGFGTNALVNNTTGGTNTAIGASALNQNTTAGSNTAVGYQAGYSNTTGALTAIGYRAGYSNSTSQGLVYIGWGAGENSTHDDNTAVGVEAMRSTTSGEYNTVIGRSALKNNTTASNNTAVGYQSLYTNTTGASNTAVGYLAGYSNTTGSNNISIGRDALKSVTTASNNTAIGHSALKHTTSNWSTAVGFAALQEQTNGNRNSALGYQSQVLTTTGVSNTSMGMLSLRTNTTGSYNTAVGDDALQASTTASENTAVGMMAGYNNTTGAKNTFIGKVAGYNVRGSNSVAVGSRALYAPAINTNNPTQSNVAVGESALILANLTSGTVEYNTVVGTDTARNYQRTTGGFFNNTAIGGSSMDVFNQTTGVTDQNVSVGYNALRLNSVTTGNVSYNVAIGNEALQAASTTTANTYYNTAIGRRALKNNNGGAYNTAIGSDALYLTTTGAENVAIGSFALDSNTTGLGNVAIGYGSGNTITTGSRNVILGSYDGNQSGLDIRTSSNNIVLSDGGGNPRLRISSTGSMGFNYPSLPSTLSTDTGSPLYVFRPSGNANATANYLNFGGTNRNANGLSKMLTFNHGYWGASREVASVGVETTSSNGGSGYGFGDLVFYTGSSGNGDSGSTAEERVRINNNGNFYVGTTTSGWEASRGTGYIKSDGYWKNTTNTSSQRAHWYFGNSNGWVGQIYTSGSSTTYSTSSDHRLKENVEYTWDATTRLKQLKPARFNFIADADTTVDGFLAHEAQAVVPESVSGTHNEVEVWKEGDELPDGVSVGDNKLDDDGNTIPVMQGIDQAKLVPLLVKTIQELEARLTAAGI